MCTNNDFTNDFTKNVIETPDEGEVEVQPMTRKIVCQGCGRLLAQVTGYFEPVYVNVSCEHCRSSYGIYVKAGIETED